MARTGGVNGTTTVAQRPAARRLAADLAAGPVVIGKNQGGGEE
jgi:hypothetical protein